MHSSSLYCSECFAITSYYYLEMNIEKNKAWGNSPGLIYFSKFLLYLISFDAIERSAKAIEILRKLDPPKLIRGNGTPVNGNARDIPPIFKKH